MWDIKSENICLGTDAGGDNVGAHSISIGRKSGASIGANSIAIGVDSMANGAASNSISIGTKSGTNMVDNAIVINATGNDLSATEMESLVVKPVRKSIGTSMLNYDAASGEISYQPVSTLLVHLSDDSPLVVGKNQLKLQYASTNNFNVFPIRNNDPASEILLEKSGTYTVTATLVLEADTLPNNPRIVASVETDNNNIPVHATSGDFVHDQSGKFLCILHLHNTVSVTSSTKVYIKIDTNVVSHINTVSSIVPCVDVNLIAPAGKPMVAFPIPTPTPTVKPGQCATFTCNLDCGLTGYKLDANGCLKCECDF